jgi:hypothetical protein
MSDNLPTQAETRAADTAAAALVPRPPQVQLAIAVLAFVAAMTGFLVLVFVEMPDSKLAIMAGFVGLAFGWGGAVVSFYFGTSMSSQAKDAVTNGAVSRLLDR